MDLAEATPTLEHNHLTRRDLWEDLELLQRTLARKDSMPAQEEFREALECQDLKLTTFQVVTILTLPTVKASLLTTDILPVRVRTLSLTQDK